MHPHLRWSGIKIEEEEIEIIEFQWCVVVDDDAMEVEVLSIRNSEVESDSGPFLVISGEC